MEVSLKRSIVKDHVSSTRHTKGKQDMQKQGARQQLVAEQFRQYQESHAQDRALAGTGLAGAVPMEQSLHRINVVTSFLKAAVPLTKIDSLRTILEHGPHHLTHSTHLGQYIPFILDEERKALMEEIKGITACSVVFDGSNHLGEALVIILRFVTTNWEAAQRLVRLRILSKSLTFQQLAREIITCLSTEYHLPAASLVAAIRDGAAVNGAAMRYVRDIMYPQAMDIICVSHTLDNVGKRFQVKLLETFLQWWVSLFAHSPAANMEWRNRTGCAVKSYCPTRWWSWYEMLAQVLECFGDVQPFLEQLTYSPAARQHLVDILHNPAESQVLQLQLAATVDVGKSFVQKTYVMEGDGEVIADAYDHLQELTFAVAEPSYPNTLAVAKKLAGDNQAQVPILMALTRLCRRCNPLLPPTHEPPGR
eukprot:scpid51838/ scgid7033/ 